MALSLGQLAVAVQTLGAFQQMQIEWVEPVATFLDLVRLLSFDIELLRTECATGRDDPVQNYVFRLVAYPCFALFLLCVLLLNRACGKAIDWDRILNTQGLIVLILALAKKTN